MITIERRPIFAAEACRRRRARRPWWVALRLAVVVVALLWLLIGAPLVVLR
jgi:uncharacterized iron-regulated membrane protein